MQYTVNEIYEAKVIIEQLIDINKISESALRKLERDIANFALNSLDKAKVKAANRAIAELYKNKNKKADWKKIYKTLEELKKSISQDMTKLNEKEILQIETEVYKEGLKEVNAHLSFSAQDHRALTLMHEQNMFWIGDHYNSYIHETVVNGFKTYVQKGLTNEELANIFETAFSGLIDRKRNYYRGLAEHVTSRLRTFANVKGYVKAGIKGLKIVAILDGRTTNICREMNGRIFVTDRLNSYIDKAISIKSEKELRQMLPMKSGNDVGGIRGIPSSSLPLASQLPPYHWRCRTRTVGYFEEFESENEKIVRNINNYEMDRKSIAKLQSVASKSNMNGTTHGINSWIYHSNKHMKEFGVKSLEGYKQKVYNIINNPDRIHYGINRYGEVIVIFEKSGLAVKTSPLKGNIYTAFGIKKIYYKPLLSELAKLESLEKEK